MSELDKKLAKWAGFKLIDTQFYEHSFGNSEVESWDYPNGKDCGCYVPNFTESLAACFSHLKQAVITKYDYTVWKNMLIDLLNRSDDQQGKEALALCLAIEKLIGK